METISKTSPMPEEDWTKEWEEERKNRKPDEIPRMLPIIELNGEKYFVDKRLRQIRSVTIPWRARGFDDLSHEEISYMIKQRSDQESEKRFKSLRFGNRVIVNFNRLFRKQRTGSYLCRVPNNRLGRGIIKLMKHFVDIERLRGRLIKDKKKESYMKSHDLPLSNARAIAVYIKR